MIIDALPVSLKDRVLAVGRAETRHMTPARDNNARDFILARVMRGMRGMRTKNTKNNPVVMQ
jgi:hypothetical protein